MLEDCFRYFKDCESYRQVKEVQLVPAAMLRPIIKWMSFCDWDLYFIGQLYLAFVEAIDVF
jgi:hypothetical protein